jgi:hypothetical protein
MEHVTYVSKNAKRHSVIPEYVSTFIIEIAVVTIPFQLYRVPIIVPLLQLILRPAGY